MLGKKKAKKEVKVCLKWAQNRATRVGEQSCGDGRGAKSIVKSVGNCRTIGERLPWGGGGGWCLRVPGSQEKMGKLLGAGHLRPSFVGKKEVRVVQKSKKYKLMKFFPMVPLVQSECSS